MYFVDILDGLLQSIIPTFRVRACYFCLQQLSPVSFGLVEISQDLQFLEFYPRCDLCKMDMTKIRRELEKERYPGEKQQRTLEFGGELGTSSLVFGKVYLFRRDGTNVCVFEIVVIFKLNEIFRKYH